MKDNEYVCEHCKGVSKLAYNHVAGTIEGKEVIYHPYCALFEQRELSNFVYHMPSCNVVTDYYIWHDEFQPKCGILTTERG